MNKELKHETVKFKKSGTRYTFNVSHNLEEFGMTLYSAFINWSERTKDFSIQSFCDYVEEKDPINIICIPTIVYQNYLKTGTQ